MHRSTSVWLAFILAVASWLAIAQAPDQTPAPAQPQAPPQEPRVLSGPDIGFRVEGLDRSGNPTGTWVVRIDGKWLPASSRFRVMPLTSK